MNTYDMVMHEEKCYETMPNAYDRSSLADGFVGSKGNRRLEKFQRGLHYDWSGCYETGYNLLMKDDGRPDPYRHDKC